MRIKCKDAQVIQSPQKLFKYFDLGNLGLSCGEVFAPDRFINFMPMNRNMARRSYTDLDTPGADVKNRNLNFISNDKTLVLFSRKY